MSGWACSSLLTTCSNEVGPDIGCVSAFMEIICLSGTDKLSDAVTIRIRLSRIRFSASSAHNSCTTRSIMMNAFSRHQRHGQRCRIPTTSAQLLRTRIWGEHRVRAFSRRKQLDWIGDAVWVQARRPVDGHEACKAFRRVWRGSYTSGGPTRRRQEGECA